MQRRNREVNIFSISLLDILCGALGAFCFMTIVLMPYYSPEAADAKELQVKQQAMKAELDRLRAALADSPNARQLLQHLNELERKIQKLQGDLNRKSRELEQEQDENRKLRVRNPLVITMEWGTRANLDLYVRAVALDKSRASEEVDATKPQFHRFPGDMQLFRSAGPGSEVMLSRDSPSSWAFEIYYKFLPGGEDSSPTEARGFFINEGKLIPMPRANLSRPGTAVHVGRILPKIPGVAQFEPAPEFAASYRQEIEKWLADNPSMR